MDSSIESDASSISSDEEIFEEMDEEDTVAFLCVVAASSSLEFFNSNKMEGQSAVDRAHGVKDQLAPIRAIPHLFRIMTNFTEFEFEELSARVVPTIIAHARSTGRPHQGVLYGIGGRPYKLSPQMRLLNCLMYLKHDNTMAYESFNWNYSRSALCDDVIFCASCLCEALANEIHWPMPTERRVLARQNPDFPGAIGIIDGTLVKIRRPKHDPLHFKWFNGHKKMYSMNNIVIVDHNGLFIYIDAGYPGSFHDNTVLTEEAFAQNWRDYFIHTDTYFEYLLGDLGYIGANDCFIMQRLGHQEVDPAWNQEAIRAYNNMHAGYRVRVEWGIGGLKRKWVKLMKRFDCTREKYCHLFEACCLMTNFLHRRRMDFGFEIIGERGEANVPAPWDGDFD